MEDVTGDYCTIFQSSFPLTFFHSETQRCWMCMVSKFGLERVKFTFLERETWSVLHFLQNRNWFCQSCVLVNWYKVMFFCWHFVLLDVIDVLWMRWLFERFLWFLRKKQIITALPENVSVFCRTNAVSIISGAAQDIMVLRKKKFKLFLNNFCFRWMVRSLCEQYGIVRSGKWNSIFKCYNQADIWVPCPVWLSRDWVMSYTTKNNTD